MLDLCTLGSLVAIYSMKYNYDEVSASHRSAAMGVVVRRHAWLRRQALPEHTK